MLLAHIPINIVAAARFPKQYQDATDNGTNPFRKRFTGTIHRSYKMSLSGLLIWLLIGGIAGWLAGVIVKGYGFGLIGNIVVGIVGAFVGGWLFGQFGILGNGILGAILGATIGAVIVLFLIRLVRSV
jgi:uncharacterized membrane protein YeaQ/YmgE (transglycosylase-associated protein family)